MRENGNVTEMTEIDIDIELSIDLKFKNMMSTFFSMQVSFPWRSVSTD